MSLKKAVLVSVSLVIIPVVSTVTNAGVNWSIRAVSPLGHYPPMYSQELESINDHGQVVGWRYLSQFGTYQAFIWSPTLLNVNAGFTYIPNLPGYTGSYGLGINNFSEAVGYSETVMGTQQAFLYLPQPHYGYQAGIRGLGYPGSSVATDVNNLGEVVGDAGVSAFIWLQNANYQLAAGMNFLGALPNGSAASVANSINNSGYITGYADAFNTPLQFRPHAFLWDPTLPMQSRMIDLGALGASTNLSYGNDVNSNQKVVGYSTPGPGQLLTPFYWSNGTMTALNTQTEHFC